MKSALPFCVNLTIAVLGLAIGGWIAINLGALLLHPDLAQTNLVTLPGLRGALAVAVKIAAFVAVFGAGVLMLCYGALALFHLRSARLLRWNVVIIANVAIGLLLLEGGIRLLDGLDLMTTNTYALLANPYCGEALSRLSARSSAAHAIPQAADAAGEKFDPVLGWVHSARLPNAEGLSWPRVVDDRPKVWFFGDSFMQGAGPPDQSAPAVFEQLRPERQAMNFGTAGYGVDQIWLSYQRLADRIPSGDPVFVGVLTVDVDRTVLHFFGGHKPHYRKVEGRFELELPPTPDARQRDEAAAWRIGSDAWALLRSLSELVTTQFDRSEIECDAEAKIEISTYAMDRVIAQSIAHHHELIWVLFVPLPDIYKMRSWRYQALHAYLQSRGQRVIDTLILLRGRLDDPQYKPESFYVPGDGHLNALGNRSVGEAMAKATL